jgi:hypothetical protein
MKSNLSQDYSIVEGIFSIKLNIPIIFFPECQNYPLVGLTIASWLFNLEIKLQCH